MPMIRVESQRPECAARSEAETRHQQREAIRRRDVDGEM